MEPRAEHCPHCGHPVDGRRGACPNCGVRRNPHAPTVNPIDRASLAGFALRRLAARGGRGRALARPLALALLVAAVLALGAALWDALAAGG